MAKKKVPVQPVVFNNKLLFVEISRTYPLVETGIGIVYIAEGMVELLTVQ